MRANQYRDTLPPGAIAQLGSEASLYGLKHMVLAPNGSWITAPGQSLNTPARSLRWLDLQTGRALKVQPAHQEGISCLALSPDGCLLASGSDDTTVVVRDVTGKMLHHLRKRCKDGTERESSVKPPPMAVMGVAFGPDEGQLISAHWNGTVTVWKARKEKVLRSARLGKEGLTGLAISWLRSIGCAAFQDGTLVAFELTSLEILWSCHAHGPGDAEFFFRHVVAQPDGDWIISGGGDGLIAVWEAETGKLLARRQGPGGPVSALDFSTDGSMLAVGGGCGRAQILAAKTALEICTLHFVGELDCLRFSSDNKTIVAAISGGIAVWDLASGRERLRIEAPAIIQDMSLSPDGSCLALAEDRSVGIWDWAHGRQLQQIIGFSLLVACSPTGRALASSGFGRAIRVWDTATGASLRSFDGQEKVEALAWSPDGRFLAAGDDEPDQGSRLMVWDVKTGELVSVAESEPLGDPTTWDPGETPWDTESRYWDIGCLAFSPDGSVLASAGTEVHEAPPDHPTWSHAIRLWSFLGLTDFRGLVGHTDFITALAFSPDGELLASGGHDGLLIIWDIGIGRPRWDSQAHEGAVGTAAFSPDGKLIASGGGDRVVRVWDSATGRRVANLAGHADEIRKVAFHPAKPLLFSASLECVLVWDLTALTVGH